MLLQCQRCHGEGHRQCPALRETAFYNREQKGKCIFYHTTELQVQQKVEAENSVSREIWDRTIRSTEVLDGNDHKKRQTQKKEKEVDEEEEGRQQKPPEEKANWQKMAKCAK